MNHSSQSSFIEYVSRKRSTFTYFSCIVLFVSLWILSDLPADISKIELPSIFTNNMILQRNRECTIWGIATPNTKIKVILGPVENNATTSWDGKWSMKLPALSAGGPYDLIVNGINGTVIHNVLIGDIWLCAGQSNIAIPLSETDDFDLADKRADYPNIRFFQVQQNSASRPQTNLNGAWCEVNPATVMNLSAVAYHFAKEVYKSVRIPIGIVLCANDGSQIKSWISEDFLGYHPRKLLHYSTSSLYNGMIAPITNLDIKGIVWYQGEADIFSVSEHKKLLPLLVRNWREKFKQDSLPFLCVQLANYGPQSESPSESSWAELREAQFQACKVIPNAYIAISVDTGGLNPGVHPSNKRSIGQRLAMIAQRVVYNKTVACESPHCAIASIVNHAIEISISPLNTRLVVIGNKIDGFVIAGADHKFYPANATIESSGDKILVSSDNVANPVAVRYAWADNPKCNLYNESNLPMAPFRSDTWKCLGSSKPYNFMNELIRAKNSHHLVKNISAFAY